MNKKACTIIALLFALFLAFMAGKSFSSTEVVNEIKADPIPESQVMTTTTGVRYERVYAYGCYFLVFSNNSGTDIEVFCMQ